MERVPQSRLYPALNAMNKRLLFACFVLAVLFVEDEACAQFTDPRNYENTPIGLNRLELGYAHAHANASIDTSLIVAGAKFDLNEGTIDYTRYFGLFNRLTWVEATVPVAGLRGSIPSANLHGSITGAGDSSYQLAMLLKGGPALTVAQFEHYKPTTTVAVSLKVSAPTGLYHSNKILNLGSDRWSFFPEIGLTQPFGRDQKWEFDAYFNAYFYTDNTSYRGKEILSQRPLPGCEAHISYTFNDSVWVSLDTRYAFHGTTFLNGVGQNDSQQNFILGSELNVSLNRRNSLTFEFANALVHQNGPALIGFRVRYNYTWGKGYK